MTAITICNLICIVICSIISGFQFIEGDISGGCFSLVAVLVNIVAVLLNLPRRK